MTAEHRPDQFVLTLSRERGRPPPPSSAFDRHRCYVDALNVFDDDLSNRFFVRCVFHPTDETLQIDALRHEFRTDRSQPVASRATCSGRSTT